MPKYEVIGDVTYQYQIVINADGPKEAAEMAKVCARSGARPSNASIGFMMIKDVNVLVITEENETKNY